VKKLRRRERSAKRGARRVGVGAPDWTLTGLAGLAAVDELIGRLGIVEVLGRGIGPIKQRDRGLSGGQLLVGMASAQLVGQDCLDGMDRVRADGGSALLTQAPVAPSRTAARLAGRFGPAQLTGIETALSEVYTRWLRAVPAQVRAPLVLRDPTIDLDASDIEVYGKTKQGVGWNYAGVRSGRVHLASWAQAELPLAADLIAGNTDVRPDAGGLLARALALMPTQVCGRPRVRADAGYFDATLARCPEANRPGSQQATQPLNELWRRIDPTTERRIPVRAPTDRWRARRCHGAAGTAHGVSMKDPQETQLVRIRAGRCWGRIVLWAGCAGRGLVRRSRRVRR